MFLTQQAILKRRAHPYALLAVSLTAVTLLTALGGLWHYDYELGHQQQRPNTALTAGPSGVARVNADEAVVQPESGTGTPQAFVPSSVAKNRQAQAGANPAVAGAATLQNNAPVSVEVSLSVNGSLKGTVTIPAGSTQCDVLQKAFDTGIIASLDMRYSSQYKTYAVYVVDGVGDSGAVWWMYTVNGKSPPYGCSGTKAANGDSVNWQYVKQ